MFLLILFCEKLLWKKINNFEISYIYVLIEVCVCVYKKRERERFNKLLHPDIIKIQKCQFPLKYRSYTVNT